jgi:hypothetical protein
LRGPANVFSCAHGAQINFRDLTSLLYLDRICEDEGVKVQAKLAHVRTAGAHCQHARAAVQHQTKHFYSARASSSAASEATVLKNVESCGKSGLFEKIGL